MQEKNDGRGCLGSLIQGTEPEGGDLAERIALLGMGFGYEGVPIDMVGLFLAGLETKKYSILLVDEFQRLNNVPEERIGSGLRKTQRALVALIRLYNYEPDIIIASGFMRSAAYREVLSEMEERIAERGYTEKLLQSVPQRHRNYPDAMDYPLNEIACVEYLRREAGIEVKLGPSKEAVYDSMMRELGMDIDFRYMIDAYALGTRVPEKVVHYIPNHKGETNGQRLFLDEPIDRMRSKLLLGPEDASGYLLRLASASAYRLGRDYLSEDEILSLHGKRLKRIAGQSVLADIIEPYREVVQDDC